MAKITFGALVGVVAGSIGNVVVQRSKAGQTLRERVIPANPKTTAQVAVRNKMTVRSKAWSALSESQRGGWDTAAASNDWTQTDTLGNSFKLSGEQLYLKLNLELESIGVAPISAVPTKAAFASIALSTITLTAGTPVFSVAYTGTLPATETLKLRASRQGSAGIMSSKSVQFVDVVFSSAASPINALTAYTGIYGALVAGQKIWLELIQVSETSGEVNVVARTSRIVSA